MPVHRAEKVPYPLDSRLRGLTETGDNARHEYVFLKDAFEYGGYSQLFAGGKRALNSNGIWEPHVFKRVSALPASCEGGLRHSVVLAKKSLAKEAKAQEAEDAQQPLTPSLGERSKSLPSLHRALLWQQQGTTRPRAILEEAAAVESSTESFAKATSILSTSRDGWDKGSKYYFVMPRAPADLLGCVRALEGEDNITRYRVAMKVLHDSCVQLHDMHVRQGRAHGDVRSENILCVPTKDNGMRLLLWDFGLAVSGDAAAVARAAKQDMLDIAKVFAMHLAPDFRADLDDENLRHARRVLVHRHRKLSTLLNNLLTLDKKRRWSAKQVVEHINQIWVPSECEDAFLAQQKPLENAFKEKWREFIDKAKEVYKSQPELAAKLAGEDPL